MKNLIFISLLTFINFVSANFLSGNDLHEPYKTHPPQATGYVMGVVDTLSGESLKMLCIDSASISSNQLSDVVKKWLEDNPQHRHFSAEGLVWGALSEASFGCK